MVSMLLVVACNPVLLVVGWLTLVQRPVDPCVWVALLAAPLVVDRISELWRKASAAHEGWLAGLDCHATAAWHA